MNVRPLALVLGLVCNLGYGNTDDVPANAGRLGYIIRNVFVGTSAAQNSAGAATTNWPIGSGDQIRTAPDARAELGFDVGIVRLDQGTSLTVLQLDDRLVRLRLEAGSVSIRSRSADAIGVRSGRTTVQLKRAGDYRITAATGSTRIIVRTGEAEVAIGDTARFQQFFGEASQIDSDGTLAITRVRSNDSNAFDRWAQERAHQADGAASAPHVPEGLVGYEDLDAYGKWRWEPELGMVWEPFRVADNWAPYRVGRWIWKAPWGWTWVDDAPWGFAPFHFGRWVERGARWMWIPGPRQIRPVYAPALVAWMESPGDSDRVGWFPLRPREKYVPPYRVSDARLHDLNTFSVASSVNAEPAGYGQPAITWAARTTFAGHPPPDIRAEPARTANTQP